MRAPVFHNMYSRAGENTFFIIEHAKNLGTTGGHPREYIYIYIYIHVERCLGYHRGLHPPLLQRPLTHNIKKMIATIIQIVIIIRIRIRIMIMIKYILIMTIPITITSMIVDIDEQVNLGMNII